MYNQGVSPTCNILYNVQKQPSKKTAPQGIIFFFFFKFKNWQCHFYADIAYGKCNNI